MHIPSKCRLPRHIARHSSSSTEPGTALEIFLDRHKHKLEAFCFDPVPEKMMPKILAVLSKMPRLRKLALCERDSHVSATYRQPSPDGNSIVDEFLCRNVENLFLDCGPNFPESWLSGMIRNCVWSLRTLKIWNCSSLSANSLNEIRRCQNLEKLEFSRVKNLDSTTLQAILESNGPRLRVLIVRQCPNVNRSVVTCIVDLECPKLGRFLYNDGRQQAFDEHL